MTEEVTVRDVPGLPGELGPRLSHHTSILVSAMVRRLIFLDIDGVLAHFGSNEQLDPACLQKLDWLIEQTGSEVILISSWRDTIGFAETQLRLTASGLRGRLAQSAPCLPHGSRSDEIETYLSAQLGPVRFVILDDVPVVQRLLPNLVLVDDFVGLTAVDVAVATRILMGVDR